MVGNIMGHPLFRYSPVRGFTTREWVDAIDFSTLRKLPAEYVSDELRKRLGDTVWAVQLRDRRYMLLMLEFQSRADPMMALRILVYTGLLYQEIVRNDAPVLDARRRLPVVLPVVLYSGTTPWRAAREFAELVQPVEPALGASRPSQRYQVLDEHHVAEEDLPEANLVTAVIRLERIESPSDLVGVVELLREWLRRPEDKGLRRAFTEWMRQIAGRVVPGGQKVAAGMTLEEMRMTTVVERVSEWPKQWVREGLEQGRAEERILLERMTALRFGTDTAQRLSAVLAEIADPERLAEVGEWLVRCETAEAFPARVESEGVRGKGGGADAQGSSPATISRRLIHSPFSSESLRRICCGTVGRRFRQALRLAHTTLRPSVSLEISRSYPATEFSAENFIACSRSAALSGGVSRTRSIAAASAS